jgi:hypothetical protein
VQDKETELGDISIQLVERCESEMGVELNLYLTRSSVKRQCPQVCIL